MIKTTYEIVQEYIILAFSVCKVKQGKCEVCDKLEELKKKKWKEVKIP